MKNHTELLKAFDEAVKNEEANQHIKDDFISDLDFTGSNGDWTGRFKGYMFTQKGDQIRAEQDIDYTPLDFVAPLVSVNKEEAKAMYPPKTKKELFVEHLELIQANFTKSLKLAYFSGFKDGRGEDYLGCDVMARWESSDVKQEIDKNG